jgi:hypothetical protein
VTDKIPKLGAWIGHTLLIAPALLIHLTQLGLYRLTGKWPFPEPEWIARAVGNLSRAGVL